MAKAAQILFVGHALVAGARGEAGGKASKDSIWGVAQVGNTLVSFSGRRGATVLRYMTHKKVELEALKAKFANKVAGKGIWYSYTDVTETIDEVVQGLADQIGTGYYKAVAARKINNTRKTQAARKAAEAA